MHAAIWCRRLVHNVVQRDAANMVVRPFPVALVCLSVLAVDNLGRCFAFEHHTQLVSSSQANGVRASGKAQALRPALNTDPLRHFRAPLGRSAPGPAAAVPTVAFPCKYLRQTLRHFIQGCFCKRDQCLLKRALKLYRYAGLVHVWSQYNCCTGRQYKNCTVQELYMTPVQFCTGCRLYNCKESIVQDLQLQ